MCIRPVYSSWVTQQMSACQCVRVEVKLGFRVAGAVTARSVSFCNNVLWLIYQVIFLFSNAYKVISERGNYIFVPGYIFR